MTGGEHYSKETKMKEKKVLRYAGALFGLPLLYAGVALLLLHFFLHSRSNALLCIAVAMEIVGVTVHYYKVKH